MQLNTQNKTIRSFRDLRAYQTLYKAMKIVMIKIIPRLPKEEKYDLADQMRRARKAPLALLAEGFAKRYQKRQWAKYLDDCIGECNEMSNHLSICHDIYLKYLELKDIDEALALYDFGSRQVYKLKESWKDFHKDE